MAQEFALRVPLVDGSRQLRLARRRSRGRVSLHRVPPRAARDRAARRARPGHGRLPPELRRHEGGAGRPAGASFRTCWSTARRASPSAWRRTSRRTTWARCAPRDRAARRAHRGQAALDTRAAEVHQGPGLPDRRPDRLDARGAARRSTRRARARISVRGEWKPRSRKRGGEDDRHHVDPVRVNKSTLVERIAEVIIARSCRCSSTCATSRPTTSASCSS